MQAAFNSGSSSATECTAEVQGPGRPRSLQTQPQGARSHVLLTLLGRTVTLGRPLEEPVWGAARR